jgi:hypothetical protein
MSRFYHNMLTIQFNMYRYENVVYLNMLVLTLKIYNDNRDNFLKLKSKL